MTSVRMTQITALVLRAVAGGHRYGFDIMEETGLTSGTVYPALDRLEREGFARSAWEDAAVARDEKRPPRRYFEITEDGKSELITAMERYRALAPITIDGVAYGAGARTP